ncbi:uncharacterized protein LOC127813246 isoform X2 [Diospyros lotus]|uniref:uncharacterized protein LOC127813246 isoform X2 n=1 Tax=Diospyros lotus TaxID=55363 RepID=UPI002254FBC4|nr:uncharacterized protein LOC127813246 isoform X2 [Diospyros lotus]
MEIFSESRKSFKMDRKSPMASSIKSSISRKLFQFLGNYTDDVLAEYIIVLVCNGKHQIQARDDLEAFLGERSAEFISWLWCHLLEFAHQPNSGIGLIDTKDVTVTSPNGRGADSDLRSSMLKDVHDHDNGNADRSPTIIGNYCHPSDDASSPVPSGGTEFSRGIEYVGGPITHLNGVNTNTTQSQKGWKAVPKEIGATESIHDNSLLHRPHEVGDYSQIPTGGEQIVNHKGNELSGPLLDFSGREIALRNLQFSIIGDLHAVDDSARSAPRPVQQITCQSKKSRVSVWDRLGKPCEEKFSYNAETADEHTTVNTEKDQEVYNQSTSVDLALNSKICSSPSEVHELDKSGNKLSECRKLEQGANMISKLHAANNIRRKRHFGEISSGPSSPSVSLVGKGGINQQDHERSHDFRKLNSSAGATAPDLVSRVQDMKQKLQQIELEMAKLRTKQLQMKRGGQPYAPSDSGVIERSEEDVESRTVFVSNVHFAATKEDLSLHFSKCGVVVNVVILTDKMNGQLKGSAHVTFSNMESVDKALALSGTSFFSRFLKVVRKAHEATLSLAAPESSTGQLSPAQSSPINRKAAVGRPFYPRSHLQWRRPSTDGTM